MKVALFVPCYVDAFFPEVGIATLELLERLGCEVDFPLAQTCCGQPMANSGCHKDARATEALYAKNFAGYDYIVTPSGSCAQVENSDGNDAFHAESTGSASSATYSRTSPLCASTTAFTELRT